MVREEIETEENELLSQARELTGWRGELHVISLLKSNRTDEERLALARSYVSGAREGAWVRSEKYNR